MFAGFPFGSGYFADSPSVAGAAGGWASAGASGWRLVSPKQPQLHKLTLASAAKHRRRIGPAIARDRSMF